MTTWGPPATPPTPPAEPAPPAWSGTAPGPAAEPVRLEYHQLLRGGRWGRRGWWRVLVGVVVAVVAVLVVQSLPTVGWMVALMGSGLSFEEVQRIPTEAVSPGFLAAVNLGWALSIPTVLGVVWLMHRLRPGWSASVLGRFRWRWFAISLGLSVVALVLTLVVSALLPAQGAGAEVSTQVNAFTAQTRNFALVVLFLTPLQAAGEEYAFRGYLTQAFGGLLAGADPRLSRAVAVLVPALLFATAHGAQDPPVFVDRLAFGIVAGILVIATGGLEAAVAMHVLNNFLAFGLALAFGDMTSALNPTGGTWWSLPGTLVQSISYTALAVWVARRTGLQTRTDPVVLAGPQPRV